jgi:hypothetical protein
MKGSAMRVSNQPVCKRCNRGMGAVATIDPMGTHPGLVAFACARCGSTNSTLIYPAGPAGSYRSGRAHPHNHVLENS